MESLTLDDLKSASEQRMDKFNAMPEYIKDLSRIHGGIVDQMHYAGFSKGNIIKKLEEMGRMKND